MTIFYIALIVCAVAFVVWLIGILRDGRRLRNPTPVKDIKYLLDRERCFEDKADDDTKTWPPGGGEK